MSDPEKWKVPKWHSDFGDPQIEVDLFKALAKYLLGKGEAYSVELLDVDPGLLVLEVCKAGKKIAEIQIIERLDRPGKWYGVFPEDGSEHYFQGASEFPQLECAMSKLESVQTEHS